MPCFCKPGTSFDGLAPGGLRIKAALDKLADTQKCAVMVTCTTEGHPPEDSHTHGNALDVRTIGWTPTNVVLYWSWLKTELGPDFTVLYEVPIAPKDPVLSAIAYVNPHATAPHFHTQVSLAHKFDPQYNVKA